MPRRAPPSALLLHQGPTPPRSAPRHLMPVLPPAALHRSSSGSAPSRPTHRPRRSDGGQGTYYSPVDPSLSVPVPMMSSLASSSSSSLADSVAFVLPMMTLGGGSASSLSLLSSSSNNSSMASLPGTGFATPDGNEGKSSLDGGRRSRSGSSAAAPLRGPWDHSGCITTKLSLDVQSILKPLQPAATHL